MTSTPDVLMMTNAVAPDKLGGLERYVRELSSALARKGAGVTILSKATSADAPPEEELEPGVRVVRHQVPRKSNPAFALIYPVRVAAQVYGQLRRRGPVAVHGHYPITALPASFGRTPYVYTFHAPVYKEMLKERQGSYRLPRQVQTAAVASLRGAERQVVRKATTCVTLSEFMRSELTTLDAPSGQACRLVPGGINTTWFTPDTARVDLWPDAAPLLFTARRLTLRTGVKELVEAMPAILERHPGARLAIAGEGGQRASVEATIVKLGLQERVRLLGRVADTELRDWYRTADLGITPTQDLEGFGLSTGEAMACGLPTLVTPVGANPELVRRLHPALVAAGTSPADLARAVVGLLDEPATLDRLRRECRACAEPAWSWDNVADEYLGIYEEAQHGR